MAELLGLEKNGFQAIYEWVLELEPFVLMLTLMAAILLLLLVICKK